MMSLVIAVHVTVCIVLITLILIQRGRGGGFIESFSGLESMFGTKTSAFLSKATSVLAVMFFFTCLFLAFLSLKESKSLMRGVKPKSLIPAATTGPANTTAVANSAQKPEAASQAQQQPSVAATTAAPANQTAK
ncbi:MAG: preprotein translocase subunit SecG [Candidatus Omnitrophica bacterium]|nr:preprotein translocase subunit SecG [Candidatus Omnitrophota bacterium]